MFIPLILFNAAIANGVEPSLLSSICFVESRHNPKAHNKNEPYGRTSIGLCQVQLRTAKWLGFKGKETDLFDPKINAHYAAKYLAYQLKRYGNRDHAVAAYNSGSIKFNSSGILINQQYVSKVLGRIYASN